MNYGPKSLNANLQRKGWVSHDLYLVHFNCTQMLKRLARRGYS